MKAKFLVLIPFLLILIVFIYGARLDIMEVDALQYAAISKEMVQNHSYLQVYELGEDYLDKPPLLFWLTSLFFNLFGANNFTYRLPALFATILTGISTYYFSKKFYGSETAYLATLILVSSQAFLLTNSDLRTDSLLISFVMMSIWQFSEFIDKKKAINFILTFVAIGLAMLAKGPLGLVVPLIAILGNSLLKRDFSLFFHSRWLLGAMIILIVLLPMTIGLYNQFGWDGVYFYYWLQSFGRITGENQWNNNPDTFFLVHSFLWSFLPWTIFIFFSIFRELKNLISKKFKIDKNDDGYSLFAFLIPFFILSLSKYQLPHYIYVVLPFASILTAKYITVELINSPKSKSINFISYFNFIFASLILLLLIYVANVYYTEWSALTSLIFIVSLILIIYYFFFDKKYINKIIWIPFVWIICLNFFAYSIVFPQLFKYQASSIIGRKVKEYNIKGQDLTLTAFGVAPHGIYFYGDVVPNLDSSKQTKYAIVDSAKLPKEKVRIIDTFYDYHISKLTLDFLNPQAREKVLSKIYLIQYYQ